MYKLVRQNSRIIHLLCITDTNADIFQESLAERKHEKEVEELNLSQDLAAQQGRVH